MHQLNIVSKIVWMPEIQNTTNTQQTAPSQDPDPTAAPTAAPTLPPPVAAVAAVATTAELAALDVDAVDTAAAAAAAAAAGTPAALHCAGSAYHDPTGALAAMARATYL
jgi:hypothetical protein